MKADLLAHTRGFPEHIRAANPGAAAGGQEQRGENSQQSGFPGPIGPYDRKDFTRSNREGDASQGGNGQRGERMQQRSPTRRGGREKFLDIFEAQGFRRHEAWL